MGNVIEFLETNVFELFAFGGELLVDFENLFGHDVVGFLGTAHQNEVRASGQPFVAVRVEAEAHHDSLAPFFLFADI